MLASYFAFKNDLGVMTGMTKDLIHVHAGLAIFVVTALLLRRRMRSPIIIRSDGFWSRPCSIS